MSNDTVGYFSRSNLILDDFLSKLAEQVPPSAPAIDKDRVLKDFEDFENAIRKSPEMRQVFAGLKKKFIEDPEYKAKVDPNFVAGVMMLNLPESE